MEKKKPLTERLNPERIKMLGERIIASLKKRKQKEQESQGTDKKVQNMEAKEGTNRGKFFSERLVELMNAINKAPFETEYLTKAHRENSEAAMKRIEESWKSPITLEVAKEQVKKNSQNKK
jgi:hypothetical protein